LYFDVQHFKNLEEGVQLYGFLPVLNVIDDSLADSGQSSAFP
jgi:hypothetical protein